MPHSSSRSGSVINAALAYALTSFAVGFALGTARTLLVVPQIGATVAVVMELPLILGACWMLSRRCITHFAVVPEAVSRIAMGALALIVLILLEMLLSVFVFQRSLAAFFAEYGSPAGAIGFAGQILYATFPYIQRRTSFTARSGNTFLYGDANAIH